MNRLNSRFLLLAGASAALALILSFVLLERDADIAASSGPDVKGKAGAVEVIFADRTLSLGATAAHRQGDDHLTGLDESLGSGACALDYDNDGWIDLFAVNGSGDTRYYGRRHWWQRSAGHTLLRNVGQGRFEDVTRQAIPERLTRGFGCVTADFDNDGHADIFVTGIDHNLLLRNLGNGKFLDVTEAAAAKGFGWQTAASAADFDGDGFLDLYVGRLVQYQKGAHTYEPGSQYKQDVPASFNSALYPAQANSLYRNLGNLQFQDVAQESGVANAEGRTLGATWLDLDFDDRQDLIVATAAGTGSTTVFYNKGKGRFTALGSETRLQMASGARGITWGDLDSDGKPEVVLTTTSGAQSAIFVKDGAASFAERGRQYGFARDEYSGLSPWSAALADMNNDGHLDILVANGLAIPDPDVPRLTVGQQKQLWLGSATGAMQAVALDPMSPLRDRQSARGIVAADFDNDGDVDFFVTHNNDLGQLLMNETPPGRHWLGVSLIDTEGNRDAVGARIAVTTTQGTQYRWIARGSGFLSGHDPRAHFGLDDATKVRRIEVTWPDGDTSTYRDIALDSYVVIERGGPVRLSVVRAVAPQGNYASLARAHEPALRADYLRLVVAARGIEHSLSEIGLAARDPELSVRRAALEILDGAASKHGLASLLDLMSDADADIAHGAVRAVCKYESEEATRWLLRMFAHPSASIRSAVADCFAFYFEEEEAVVHRKYLALPYLVELLRDETPATQIAAIRALGAAERFRGAPALVDLARETQRPDVRAEAIRAIGLIRDKHVNAPLLAMLANPKLQAEPASVAQLLVALKRLDQPGLPAILRDFGGGRQQFARMSPHARLAAMRELAAMADGVVLGPRFVAQLAQRSFAALASSSAADSKDLVLLIDILREGAEPRSIALLKSLAARTNTPEVAAAALRALIVIDPVRAGDYVDAAIAAADVRIGSNALRGLDELRIEVSKSALDAALNRPEQRAAVLNIVRRIRDRTTADTIFGIAVDSAAPTDARAAAMEALARSPFKFHLPASAYSHVDEAFAVAVVRYEFSKLPELIVSRTAPTIVDNLLAAPSPAVQRAVVDVLAERAEFWAKTKILMILKESDDSAVRHHILGLLAKDALQGSRMLETIAMNKTDPLRIDALRQLEGRQGSSAEQLLMTVLRDRTESQQARIVAAHRLTERLGADVLRLLQSS